MSAVGSLDYTADTATGTAAISIGFSLLGQFAKQQRVANEKRNIRNRNRIRNQMALNTGFSFSESKRCHSPRNASHKETPKGDTYLYIVHTVQFLINGLQTS